MPEQLSDSAAVLVHETDATVYHLGGGFTLGAGPFTGLSFTAQDDETDFSSFGAQYGETWGSGRQTGDLIDSGGGTFDQGLASLEDVLTLSHPVSGAEVLVGRVALLVDNGSPGGGSQTQDFYIFSGPIDAGVTYTVTHIEYTPGSSPASSFEYSDFADGNVVCFTAGTLITTDRGDRRVQDIVPGDRVLTADNGFQPVVWNGVRTCTRGQLAADIKLAPVAIAQGAMGNAAALLVSQQHRILVGGQFVKAKHLVEIPGLRARIASGKRTVTYHHLLLEDHQVLFANGVGAESLFLGPMARRTLASYDSPPKSALTMSHRRGPYGGLSRPMAKRHKLPDLMACMA